MTKKELELKFINNETIEPFCPEWMVFHQEQPIPNTITEYKTVNYKFYKDYVLWQFANGELKPIIKRHLIDKINMILSYNTISEYDKVLLNVLTDILNEYFAMMPIENRKGTLNGQKVSYSWNKVIKYNIIDPTIDKNYDTYQLQIITDDWINHKINGQRTDTKFAVDQYGRIILTV